MYMWPIAPTVLDGQMKRVQWLVPRVIMSVDTHGPRMLGDQNGPFPYSWDVIYYKCTLKRTLALFIYCC